MPQRPPNYPLDVTPLFTTAGQQQIGQGIGPVGSAANGTLHGPDGDLRNFVVFSGVRNASREIYRVAAYADLIDQNLVAFRSETGVKLEEITGRVHSLRDCCEGVMKVLDQIVAFLGVLIPNWRTKKEVEEGDDMGVVSPSAAELDLVVVFETDRLVPGFGHEDVISISPLPGTLVKRGSTVTVKINLLG